MSSSTPEDFGTLSPRGQEELEQRFEAVGLRYWEIERDSVI